MVLDHQPTLQAVFNIDVKALKENLGGVVITKAKYRWFWRLLDRIFRLISRGKSTDFMQRATTVGHIIAFGEQVNLANVTKVEYVTLRHEITHVKQAVKLGIDAAIGVIPFLFLYLFVPLPAWRSWFRFKFEREAFIEEYKAAKKCGWILDINRFAEALSGPQYLYAWPKEKVREWLVKEIDKLGRY